MDNITTENRVRRIFFILCEGFTFCTLILLIHNHDYADVPICLATFAMICIPITVEKLFSCRMNLTIYLFGLIYSICPMLGDCYKLYYSTTWWDKALHTFGGVIFALFGLYLFEFLNGNKTRIIACAIFALCFSVTLSVLWEFVEFGADQIFGTDMQHDTVISTINSYMFGNELGVVGRIDDIQNVTINGTALPTNGYLDVGLIDSMMDMLFETVGAAIVSFVYILDKGRHPAFVAKTDCMANIR